MDTADGRSASCRDGGPGKHYTKTRLFRWISGDGVRQDAGHCFLYPALKAPGSNVTLRVMCRVSKVIFEGTRAVGVEYIDLTADNFPRTRIATARKLVVLSSGAFGSPGILERSGIGASAVLSAAGIPVRVQLDGVGENYQDHNLMTAQYSVEPGATAMRNAVLMGDPNVRIESVFHDSLSWS